MVRKSYNSGSYVAYTYNAEGSLARLSYGDSTGELASYRFEYDSLGRLIRSAELDADGGTVQRTEHIYDGYNRLSRQSWTLGGKTYSESYVYDDPSDTNKNGDGALTQMTTATGAVIDYQYDTLRRLTHSEVTLNGSTVYTTAYAFRDLNASRTTTQVQYRNVRNANGEVLEGKKYTYDALGNITRISQSTKPFYTLVAYEYDAQNQLRTETRYTYSSNTDTTGTSVTYTYNYDTAGNLQSVQKNGATVQTYTYGDSQWRDLLTKVGGTTISYDASGNPKNWYNGTTYTGLTWENGRQLTSITTGGKTATYTYDADGIRTYKKVGNAEHEYRILNGKVVYEKLGSGSTAKIMIFSYDAQGRPFAVKYSTNNGGSYITYFYALNQQGDVVKIFRALPVKDSDGNLIGRTEKVYATYTYDAWGKLIGMTDANGNSILDKQDTSFAFANRNPLRYRGYYYDVETGFYYLQSRYYDPANHRFINADAYASTDSNDAISCNMFAYCGNNPANRSDETGDFWNFVVGAVAGAVVNAVSTAVSAVKEGGIEALTEGKTWAKIGVSAATGAIGGVVAASGVGIVAASAWGAGTAAIESAGHQLIDNGKIDGEQLLVDTVVGAIGGAAGGKGATHGNKYMSRQYSRFFRHLGSDGIKKLGHFISKQRPNTQKSLFQVRLGVL